ncbi:LPXTG cell wall anchor domain-containing protein [Kutzneria buriramensis]|uniref:LPXTG-motif cell wall-anchored protein n=1 Tax=Kutzneria buriramensis TaxID=1045776 RepID=A0A3E0I8F5_9PSEU|nr:LPXTG cell wall anchor domain-containing protein [Kutzneria buriramensis]REH55002.1 LPXTG-motif cell wall-anchored protein [Kutzneria buriramensis]
MRRIAAAALAAVLLLLSVAAAHADTTTVTISGVAWKDLNGDGIRQPDEPLLPGIKIGDTATDATDHYTLHDVVAAAPSVQASPRAIDGGKYVYIRPHQGDAATDIALDHYGGPSSWADPVGTTGLDIRFLRAQESNGNRAAEVSGKVTKEIDGRLTAQLIDTDSDVDPSNNAASAPTTTSKPTTTTAPVAAAAQLANTGVDAVWWVISGVLLLAGGVATLFLARRR